MHPPPAPAAGLSRWERRLAAAVHWGFYAIMIGMPLSGWLAVSATRIEVPTLLYGVVPWPHLPGVDGLAPDAKALAHEIGKAGHGLLAKGAFLLIALHVAGALKHQFWSRDVAVLHRMAPGARPGRRLEPRLLIIAAGLAGAVALGRLASPRHADVAPPPPRPVVAAPVEAPKAAPVETPPAAARETGPVRWTVASGSTLAFETSWSGEAVRGRFERWRAAIDFSPEALDRSKVVVSIDVGSAVTGDEQRDAALRAGDWFDVETHPSARFTADRFKKTGPDRYVAHGVLDLRGVKRPLDLAFSLKITGERAHVQGLAELDRLAFGVGQGEWASPDQIPAKVTVRVDLKARRN
jgi:polyisoprenoid-binding protein YceI